MQRGVILLLMFCLGAAAEQYIVTYRGVVKENRLYSERFNVSRAMTPRPEKTSRELLTLDYEPGTPIPLFLRTHQDLLTRELFKQGILMNDALNARRYGLDTKTVITFPPTYITVTIKEDSATIHLIK